MAAFCLKTNIEIVLLALDRETTDRAIDLDRTKDLRHREVCKQVHAFHNHGLAKEITFHIGKSDTRNQNVNSRPEIEVQTSCEIVVDIVHISFGNRHHCSRREIHDCL